MKKSLAMAALALAVSFGSVACKKKVSDADLTTKVTSVVSTNPNASVEVKDGVAHLSGTFASEQEKADMITKLKATEGIKDVHDMATVAAPVATTNAVDPAVQQKVKDAVKDYPGVKVETVNGELTITGNVTQDQAKKIKQSVDALKVGKVNYKYTVK